MWDAVPLGNHYHVNSGVISFNPVSDPNPDVKATRQLRDLISFKRRRVEMIDKNKFRDLELQKLQSAKMLQEEMMQKQPLFDNSTYIFDSKGQPMDISAD